MIVVSNVTTLKKRVDFLRIAKSPRKVVTAGLVLQCAARPDQIEAQSIRTGLVVSKKLGNAVARNRIKRRYRALIRDIFPSLAQTGFDYVIMGKKSALDRPYSNLGKDMRYALHTIHES